MSPECLLGHDCHVEFTGKCDFHLLREHITIVLKKTLLLFNDLTLSTFQLL